MITKTIKGILFLIPFAYFANGWLALYGEMTSNNAASWYNSTLVPLEYWIGFVVLCMPYVLFCGFKEIVDIFKNYRKG
ncbi:MAG: hypothetical protein ACK5LP_05045 [Campylobacteraceae bacterium]